MVGWHHRLYGHEFEQTSGVGDGQGSLVCCSPWSCKELDTTEPLNWTELIEIVTVLLLFYVLVFQSWGTWDLSSPTGNRTLTACIGRWSLNHWIAREVLLFLFHFHFKSEHTEFAPCLQRGGISSTEERGVGSEGTDAACNSQTQKVFLEHPESLSSPWKFWWIHFLSQQAEGLEQAALAGNWARLTGQD